MPKFIVLKNGRYNRSIIASGNLQALCEVVGESGFPKFPMYTHEGLLLAKVNGNSFMVFDCNDNHAESIAKEIAGKSMFKPLRRKISDGINQLIKLPTMKLEVSSHVV